MNTLSLYLLAGIALAAGLGGCTAGPTYAPPAVPVPRTYAEAAGPAVTASRPEPGVDAPERWWLTFHDPELEALIRRAVAGNGDLKIAASRVREARAEFGLAEAAALPAVAATAGYNRGRGSANVTLPFGGGSGSAAGAAAGGTAASTRSADARTLRTAEQEGGGPAAPPSSGAAQAPAGPTSPFGEGGLPGTTTNLYQAGFDASWEIDVFGGTRRAVEAAGARIEGFEEQRRDVLVSLLAETATDYLQLRTAQRRLAIARDTLAGERDLLGLVRARFAAGFVTGLDVARQEAEVAAAGAAAPPEEAKIRGAEHALEVIIGTPPGSLDRELNAPRDFSELPPLVPIGLPSDLLRRRPDIRRAERALAAATAEIGVATADLFPRFSLTGAFGLDSSRPADLPEWSSRYYSIIPGLRWPLLDWGRVHDNIRVRNELQRQALTAYEQTVSQALTDVEDGLVRYRTEQERRSALAQGVAAGERSVGIARAQYEHGTADATSVLAAEHALFAARSELAESDGNLRTDLVALYKALGGGW